VDRRRWIRAKQAEIAALRAPALSEVTPSRRDFHLYVSTQRRELAVIARVQCSEPETGSVWTTIDPVAYAVACDEAEVAALAVATDEQRGGTIELLDTVADVTSAPVLRDDLTLDPGQIYDARLRGADAVVLPAGELTVGKLAELADVAVSLHVAAVVEVQSARDLAKTRELGRVVVGLRADLRRTLELADQVPADQTVIALQEPPGIEAIRRLRGHVDAVVVGPLLLDSSDVAATLAALGS